MLDTDIFVYQMGKVGSGSITRIIHDSGEKPLHGHWIAHAWPKGEFQTPKPKIVKEFDQLHPMKVVTPIREPVARNISAFFQNMGKYCKDSRNVPVEKLQAILLEEYNIHYPDQWFELELMKVFKLDPFKEKFDYQKGYKTYQAGKHKFLILRLEDADRVVPGALKKFLGINGVKMIRRHIRVERTQYVGQQYKEFLRLPFPEEFLDRCYNLKYAQHFYTEEERYLYKLKWLG